MKAKLGQHESHKDVLRQLKIFYTLISPLHCSIHLLVRYHAQARPWVM